MNNLTLCPKASRLVDGLFSLFWSMCDGWNSQFPVPEKLALLKEQWILAFMETGFTTNEQIAHGISTLRKQKKLIYTPAIGHFLEWCKTPLNDAVFYSPDQAYQVAYAIMRDETPSDITDEQLLVIKHTIKSSESWFLKSNNKHVTQPVFFRNYEITLRDFSEGKLKPIPKALPNSQLNNQDDDGWKTMRKLGLLPQYAYLKGRNENMPVIMELLARNGGSIGKPLPYDKTKKLS